MGAFSTLALIGLAGAVGAFGGKKLAQKGAAKAAQQTLATPAPTNQTLTAPPPPLPITETASTSIGQGQAVAGRQRRKAAGGGTPPLKMSATRQPRTIVRPATLIGGGY